MSKYTAKQIKNWDVQQAPDWKPARPINYRYESIFFRIRLAFGVLTGKYDALDWEDGPRQRRLERNKQQRSN